MSSKYETISVELCVSASVCVCVCACMEQWWYYISCYDLYVNVVYRIHLVYCCLLVCYKAMHDSSVQYIMFVYIHVCSQACLVRKCVCVHVCVCMCACMCVCVCMYVHRPVMHKNVAYNCRVILFNK